MATTWLLVEQAGPWGAKALGESHLDPAVGRALEAAAAGTGVRVALIRRPGRHADCLPTARHEVLVAHTVPGRGWVRRAGVADPAELLGLDFAALGAGDHTGFGAEHVGGPVALVCTNGRRDRCCALLGRPLAAELAAAGHSEVWEVTHLGGHRFSPTMLVLPYGYAYGRLTAETAKEVLAATAAGHMVPEWSRGCSGWDRPGQAAEHAVRLATGETGVDSADAHPAAGRRAPLAGRGAAPGRPGVGGGRDRVGERAAASGELRQGGGDAVADGRAVRTRGLKRGGPAPVGVGAGPPRLVVGGLGTNW